MHQAIDTHNPHTASTTDLAQRLRRALAADLQLPEQHPAVNTTLHSFAFVARGRRRTAPAIIDTWWCIVAHTRARARR